MEGSTVELQTPARWKLIGSCITFPLPVLSPKVFFHHIFKLGFNSRKEKFGVKFKNLTIGR
jgi:hypothetical protein